MLFSIIVPVYNAEKTLENCLNSIKLQSFCDYELILVNDGSQDSSLDICKVYERLDSRIVVIDQENKGVSAARNRGLEIAKGKYIAFLDSDDSYHSNYLLKFKDMIDRYPECNNYWCSFIYKSSDQNFEKKVCSISRKEDISVVSRKDITLHHSKTMDAPLWNKVFKNEIIKKYNIRMDENLSLGEDMLFNYAYLDLSGEDIAVINSPLYNYSCNSDTSLNNVYRDNLREIYQHLHKNIFEYLKKWQIPEEQYALFYSSVFYACENVLRNTFRSECKLSTKEKYCYNNELLRSKLFIESMRKSKICLHLLYRMAYQSKNYRVVQFVDQLVEWKQKLKKERES